MNAFVLLWVLLWIWMCITPAFRAILVQDCIDLQNINNNLNETYTLTNDIDCRNTSEWNSGAGFLPIALDVPEGFCGILNGENYTIWHLKIERPTTIEVGLFHHLCSTAQVFDLQLHDYNIIANSFIGPLTATNDGFIYNVNVSGQVIGQNYIAGLVSFNTGVVAKASVFGVITGYNGVGGVISINNGQAIALEFSGEVIGYVQFTGSLVSYQQERGMLIDSHANATVTVTGSYAGGVTGVNFGLIKFTRFSGRVVSTPDVQTIGGLVGLNDVLGVISDCQGIVTVIGTQTVGGAAGSNGGQMEQVTISGTVLASFGSNRVGGLIGEQYDTGTLVNSNFTGIVEGSLYLGGVIGYDSGETRSVHFSGFVNGSAAGDKIGGLVGFHLGGTLNDAHAVAQVIGSYFVGGAVGHSSGGTVSSVTFEGEVIGQNPGERVGGLIGQLESSLSNSYVNATVTGYYRVGGAVGFNNDGAVHNTSSYTTVIAEDRLIAGFIGENNGNVSNCTFSGEVSGQIIVAGFIGANTGDVVGCSSSGTITGGASVGGFIAQNAGSVTHCSTTATVSATSDRVGGIVADNQATGTISDCFSNATLFSERDDVGAIAGLNSGVVVRCQGYGMLTALDKVGGLIGRQLSTGQVKQSYTYAQVIAELDRAGGAVGENAGLIEECASLSSVSGQDEVGGLIGRSTDITNIVLDSYAVGCVEAKNAKGGLTGSQANGVFSNVYWDKETTQQQDPAGKSGSFNLRSNGKSTRNLYHERTYSNWKFGDNETWSIIEGHSYPYHQNFNLEALPVASESHCPRKTTFYEIWIPRILFLISFIALGLWLETLEKHYRHRRATQKNLKTILNTTHAATLSKNTPIPTKVEDPLIRETKIGDRGYTSQCLTSGDPLDGALRAAVLNGYYDLAVWLTSQGASPLMTTENQETALHLVVITGARVTAYHLTNLSPDPTVWPCHFERILLALNEDDCAINEIDISAHAVDDEMFQRLIDAMSKSNTIKTLDVSCNNIADLGLMYFAHHASSLNALETVNLSHNLLGDDGIWALKQKLPSKVNVLLEGNVLLSPNRSEWSTINTPPTGMLTAFSAVINRTIPFPWKFALAKYQIIPTFGFFMGILDKVLDGLLILELDQTYQEDLTIISFSFFVISSLVVGLLAIRVLYGSWLPQRLAQILHWILFLPLLTPELVRLQTGMGYIDSPLVILKFIQFLLEDIPQFVISIIFVNRKGLNLIALSRLSFSFIGSVSLFVYTLYSLPTLRNSVRQLRGSAELMMTQLDLRQD